MNTLLYYHNTNALLSNVDKASYTRVLGKGGLLSELQAMPVSVWPDKSKHQKDKSVLQCVHNAHLRHTLDAAGWNLEPLVSKDLESGRRADFSAGTGRRKVLVEVEFGNSARLDSAIVKFQTAYYQNTLSVAVLVVATQKMARDTDSGLATFEAMVRALRTLDPRSVPFPLVVIGLEPGDSTRTLDWSTATKFSGAQQLSGRNRKATLAHAVSELLNGVVLEDIGPPVTQVEVAEADALARRLNERTPAAAPRALATPSWWARLTSRRHAYRTRERKPFALALSCLYPLA